MKEIPFRTAQSHIIHVEHQKNNVSLARRGQSLQPRELVRRLSEGGQIPSGNIYDHYMDSDFSEHDYEDTASIARIDPLEYIDQSREMLERYAGHVKKTQAKPVNTENDKQTEIASNADAPQRDSMSPS